jgi:uncharacterized membrane protein
MIEGILGILILVGLGVALGLFLRRFKPKGRPPMSDWQKFALLVFALVAMATVVITYQSL